MTCCARFAAAPFSPPPRYRSSWAFIDNRISFHLKFSSPFRVDDARRWSKMPATLVHVVPTQRGEFPGIFWTNIAWKNFASGKQFSIWVLLFFSEISNSTWRLNMPENSPIFRDWKYNLHKHSPPLFVIAGWKNIYRIKWNPTKLDFRITCDDARLIACNDIRFGRKPLANINYLIQLTDSAKPHSETDDVVKWDDDLFISETAHNSQLVSDVRIVYQKSNHDNYVDVLYGCDINELMH